MRKYDNTRALFIFHVLLHRPRGRTPSLFELKWILPRLHGQISWGHNVPVQASEHFRMFYTGELAHFG